MYILAEKNAGATRISTVSTMKGDLVKLGLW